MLKTDIHLGIIGYGMVGQAVEKGFCKRGFVPPCKYDPEKGYRDDRIYDTDIVFICVPTPAFEDGAHNPMVVSKTIERLFDNRYCGLIVIKSTILPSAVDGLRKRYSALQIATNPEFLSDATAVQDFENQKFIVVGANGNASIVLYDLYRKHWPDAEVVVTTPEAAMMIKYMTNCLFATKVTLMNEFYRMWVKDGNVPWEELTHALSMHPWVGKEHLQVPGPDGKFGFGGKCFPKDTQAMTATADMPLLEAVVKANEIYRKDQQNED